MPGVPTSRGCEACRKQKKKCDQLKPACTRCARLRIPCIGSGQRRYKFKSGFTFTKDQGATIVVTAVPRAPSSETDEIAAAFVEVLQIKDVRYDVTWYGPFLESLPERIGKSPALDAAISSLTCAVTSLRTRQQSPEVIRRYVNGLAALRTCLNDPIQTRSVHTVCAIYLLMVCQSWIGRPEDQFADHSQILTHILNNSVVQGWKGKFEEEMIFSLSMPVVFHSIINPGIPLGPWFWSLVQRYKPVSPVFNSQGNRIPTLNFYTLAQITQWVRNPALHFLDIAAMYHQLLADCIAIRAILDAIAERVAAGMAFTTTRPSTHPQAAYSMVICVTLILNRIQRVFDPDSVILAEESAELVNEAIFLANTANQFRPLGACFMPVTLAIAWTAADNTPVKSRLEEILLGYESDFTATRWLDTCRWMEKRFDEWRIHQPELFISDSI